MVVMLTAQMVIASKALLRLGVFMKEQGSVVIKKLITTSIRLVIAALKVTWVISLVSIIDLSNLAILIYYLW